MENVSFKNVSSEELERAIEVECECELFRPRILDSSTDDLTTSKASRQMKLLAWTRLGCPGSSIHADLLMILRYRQAHAPDLFLGAYLAKSPENHELIGYVCSTLSPSQSLTHDSMSKHVSGSSSVCLHSVTIIPAYRRKGIASALLREYISRLSAAGVYERILLITHEELQRLYEGVGFEFVGLSPVQHGSRPWYEMRKVLSRSASPPAHPEQLQSLPPGLLEALKPSGRKMTARSLQDFPGGIQDVSTLHTGTGVLRNKYELVCPRTGCGCTILKSGIGDLDEKTNLEVSTFKPRYVLLTFKISGPQMDPPDKPIHPDLTPLPAPPVTTHWWLIKPSPFAFENVGFTRPVPSVDQSSGTYNVLKYSCNLTLH